MRGMKGNPFDLDAGIGLYRGDRRMGISRTESLLLALWVATPWEWPNWLSGKLGFSSS